MVLGVLCRCMLSISNIKSFNPTFSLENKSKRISFTQKADTFVASNPVGSASTVDYSDLMKERFSEKQLANLSKKTPEYRQKVEDLASTKLTAENILSFTKYSNIDFNSKKLVSKISEMEKLCGENLETIEVSNNRYDEKAIDIVAKTKDNIKKSETLDENLNIRSVQETFYENINGKKIEIKKAKDFKNGVTSEVKSHVISEESIPVPLSEVIITKDYKEISEPSEVKGVFNTVRIFNDGVKKQISSGSIDKKTGIKTVKKDMTSFDGTRTQYEYSDDPLGNRIVDYKITDKKGNVLYKNSEAFEVVDENTFISSKNDKSYEIKYSDDDNKLSVKDRKTNDSTELDLHMFIFGSKSKLIPTLKKVSGDELIKMSQNVKRLFYQDSQMNSSYKPGDKDVNSNADDYILIHELGHAKDMKDYDTTSFKTKDATEKLLISSNPKVIDTYLEEKSLFNEHFSDVQRENIDYFINGTGRYPASRSVKETIAEINAILNTCNDVEKYSLRSMYMQQYFPKTISTLAEML